MNDLTAEEFVSNPGKKICTIKVHWNGGILVKNQDGTSSSVVYRDGWRFTTTNPRIQERCWLKETRGAEWYIFVVKSKMQELPSTTDHTVNPTIAARTCIFWGVHWDISPLAWYWLQISQSFRWFQVAKWLRFHYVGVMVAWWSSLTDMILLMIWHQGTVEPSDRRRWKLWIDCYALQ